MTTPGWWRRCLGSPRRRRVPGPPTTSTTSSRDRSGMTPTSSPDTWTTGATPHHPQTCRLRTQVRNKKPSGWLLKEIMNFLYIFLCSHLIESALYFSIHLVWFFKGLSRFAILVLIVVFPHFSLSEACIFRFGKQCNKNFLGLFSCLRSTDLCGKVFSQVCHYGQDPIHFWQEVLWNKMEYFKPLHGLNRSFDVR